VSTLIGTASDYLDLLRQLRNFLTTDATLTAAGQNWTELATNAVPYVYNGDIDGNPKNIVFETYLRAPGLSTTEQIYIQLGAYYAATLDIYNWRMRGALGYTPASTWFQQPGASPDNYIALWNQPIPFWFIANGQRVIVVAKIATDYEMCYLGKFLPDGVPGEYPYPLFIGGTGGPGCAADRYSRNDGYHAAFFDPNANGVFTCDASGAWITWNHWGGTYYNANAANAIWPWNDGGTSGFSPNQGGMNWIVQNIDGSYPLLPSRLEQSTPSINILGSLDGVFGTTGQGSSSETTFAVGADTYITFQDTFRNARNNFVAFKLS